MKFTEYEYKRPDFSSYKLAAQQAIEKLKMAKDDDEAIAAVTVMKNLMVETEKQSQIAYVRHSINTNDSFYEGENDYWNEYGPLYEELYNEYYHALLGSPFRVELELVLTKQYFKMAEYRLKTFSPEAISLLQQENELGSKYDKLIASAKIEFDGKVLNLSQLGPYQQSTDRSVRKAASEAYFRFFQEKEAEIDTIYDQLVKVRDQIAKTLGFKDFVELGYLRMERYDYNREMVQTFRKQVLEEVVPVTNKLYERQAKRINVEKLHYYDLNLDFLDGNATPKGDPAYIMEMGKKMYHELSPETAHFIDYMYDHELLDLETKEGKASGGYCTFIPEYDSPFIFANFNGTSGDIDVLTHEAGHAFQVFQSRWIPQPEIVFPTSESAEIHSMSMEFFTYPWMELFFKEETEKYKFTHLSGALQFLPYGVLVDHYQHEVYENPWMTPAERKATWRKLEKMYNPHKDFSENEFLDQGTLWFRQGHIFTTPFYYIDYALAQVCAFQFWKRAIHDQDMEAWQDYIAICEVGGTKSFLELVDIANLKSPFEEGSLTEIVQAIDEVLSAVDDTRL
ncbi:M3 family oligoendopeptidase [Jeotgalibaca caeni]|uniref:M3 family oligoendopeptidase n=1 Tax=Jeotgalibaca caeni TaxID=3028623 RepID=UPI00237D4840|nr:M3 family oligoendopeptidase [Jeotgalibaca caeni]MDE1548243.1 M3 family oligoendopeptidase [Jeotgalibaca caeni]